MTVPNPAQGQPMQQAPAQPYVPPVAPTQTTTPRPPLSKADAHRARLAGGIGGGIAWLGLGISQAAILLLALPFIVSAVIFGIGFALSDGGPSATGGVWPQLTDWLGSAAGIAVIAAIPLGVVVWLVGLWISARILRRGGVHRPVGVTWAGFGIAAAANILLGSLGSITIGPAFGGLPFAGGPNLDFDPSDTYWGAQGWSGDPGDFDPGAIDPGLLERIADPGQLVALAGPWVALGSLVSLIVPIILSIFAWWWMAHALRAPARPEVDATA
ncbi:hypothetical protein L332_02215 [Agrococcus pavilionensis RW1]|uniref:Uncharacterized protein n=1 Tax=Agrococcus pavilionensis RW1 TaxID=1330458 RepID=U1LMW5_9MICO|nr:hypothetical protein [Agrococcus pavilionensis]ERG63267.1 hypothetical protein L332_02215 [Agrococcus pavilionensis RW1]